VGNDEGGVEERGTMAFGDVDVNNDSWIGLYLVLVIYINRQTFYGGSLCSSSCLIH